MVYAITFKMCPNPWNAGIIVFDTGEVKMNRQNMKTSKTLVIELEGTSANTLQVEMCRYIWESLCREFPFELSIFSEGVVEHSAYILTGAQ